LPLIDAGHFRLSQDAGEGSSGRFAQMRFYWITVWLMTWPGEYL